MKPIEKAESEIANGRLWRARDILRANAGFAPYDVELYRKLGEVLLLMHDVPEARKYLFLSGSQDPDHTALIAAFGNKFRMEPNRIFNHFPKPARLQKISDYPEVVARNLRTIGVRENLKTVNAEGAGPTRTLADHFEMIGCFAVIGLIAILLILGVVKMIEILYRWFS